MHGDYQLAYCSITQIILLAFCDDAFFNTKLTPELIWWLQVPNHCLSLSLWWKPKILNMLLLQCLDQTSYSYKLHKSLLMIYRSSWEALRELGWDAKFKDNIRHYNYHCCTANEVNHMSLVKHDFMTPFPLLSLTIISGNFISQKQQRVLGQSGNAVFEKHYQSQFIGRDLQHVILLQPPQEDLLHATGSMLRKRDSLALSNLTNAHKHAICQNPDILQLRQEKRELTADMWSLSDTIMNAWESLSHLYQRHWSSQKKNWPSFRNP